MAEWIQYIPPKAILHWLIMPSGAKKVKFFVIVARILSRRVWIRARSFALLDSRARRI